MRARRRVADEGRPGRRERDVDGAVSAYRRITELDGTNALALKELALGLPAKAVGMKGVLGSGATGAPGLRGARRATAGRPGIKKRRR